MLKAGQRQEAERVYNEDLKTLLNNGWALLGLAKAQQAQNKVAMSQQTRSKAMQAWRWADKQLVQTVQ